MTTIQTRLINAYTILVMAGRITLAEVPRTTVVLDDSIESTIRQEVEIEQAKREIETLS